MKAVKLNSFPGLDGLVKEIYESAEHEPISLENGDGSSGAQVAAVLVSVEEYRALKRLEETRLDKLDREESEEILKDPNWIDWDHLKKQLKP